MEVRMRSSLAPSFFTASWCTAALLAAVSAPAFGADKSVPEGHDGKPLAGYVALHPTSDSGVSGSIAIRPLGEGRMRVSGAVKGLTPGEHGFHIHEFGDCSAADASTAGAHFTGGKDTHGGPNQTERHAGDLGNILADESGTATIDIEAKALALTGMQSVAGRSLVVHSGKDDLKSQPSGNSGGRVACGVIGIRGVDNQG
jgi:superoxide dismutase, Cu-Zn family